MSEQIILGDRNLVVGDIAFGMGVRLTFEETNDIAASVTGAADLKEAVRLALIDRKLIAV